MVFFLIVALDVAGAPLFPIFITKKIFHGFALLETVLTRRSLHRKFLYIRWGGGLFSPHFPNPCKLFCFSIVHGIVCVCAQRNQVPLTPCILRKFIGWPYVMYCCCVYVSAIPSILSASEFVPIQDSLSKSFPSGIFVIHKAHFPFHCVAQPPVHAPGGCIWAPPLLLIPRASAVSPAYASNGAIAALFHKIGVFCHYITNFICSWASAMRLQAVSK